MRFIAFTNKNLEVIALDQSKVVDTIFIDLEILGKEVRQAGTNSLISYHQISDIERVRNLISNSHLGVRINPLNAESRSEINQCINNGTNVLMLPMFETYDEVKKILDFIDGRCKLDLLVETPRAIENLKAISKLNIHKFHFGINDLSLAYKKKHMFEMFFMPCLEKATRLLHDENISFGIGGIGALKSKPYDPILLLAMNRLLNSERLILSRSFLSAINTSSKESAINSCNYQIDLLEKEYNLIKSLSNKDLIKYRDKLQVLLF